MRLSSAIPGLSLHRERPQSRAPQYAHREARQCIDQLFFWMEDSVPEDLLEWLQVHDPDQLAKVMAPWREIDVCDKNQDLAGVKSACAAMVSAMQQGLRLYNAAPVQVGDQANLF